MNYSGLNKQTSGLLSLSLKIKFLQFISNVMAWICPECNRNFRSVNQAHSCIVTDMERHFINKAPNVHLVFQKVIQEDIVPNLVEI